MERPMLFNTEMVRAILDGRKTQTRRLIRFPEGMTGHLPESGARDYIYWPGGIKRAPYRCGDILWVRETWKQYTTGTAGPGLIDGYLYKADEPQDTSGMMVEGRWHPSIHMPKKAARIWLKVTNIRCERLQDITFADIQAEGMDMDEWYEYDEWQHSVGEGMGDVPVIFENPYHFFGNRVWDTTMGSLEQYEKYGWDANPWVWVIEFERIENKQLLSFADRDSARYCDQGVLMPAT